MRAFALLALMIFVSCGKVEAPKAQDGTENFKPQAVTGNSLQQFQLICDSLIEKENVLDRHVLERVTHNLELKTQIACSGARASVPGFPMTIQSSASRDSYVFVYGLPAPLANVETTQSGVMEEICSNLRDLRSPVPVGNEAAMSFTIITKHESCVSDSHHLCVQINQGPLDASGTSFPAHEQHWIQFRTSGPLKGFVKSRKYLTVNSCHSGKQGHAISFK